MSATRQDAFDCIDRLAEAVDSDTLDAGEALRALLELLAKAFLTPQVVHVTDEHLNDAVALTTAYIDTAGGQTGGGQYDMLAALVTQIDDRAAVDGEYRVGIFAALAQLVSDALTAAVVAGGATEDNAAALCQSLLQRLVLLR